MVAMAQEYKTPMGQHAQKILQALRDLGPDWHSRAVIAAHLNKRRLNPAEVAVLNMLVESGRVEAERHIIDGPMPMIWEYRIRKE